MNIQSIIARAEREGALPKASTRKCEHCGATAEHRHHEDYSKPLEVIFLCRRCHWARHRELGWGVRGNPRFIQSGYVVRITISLPVELHEFAKEQARKQHRTLSGYIARLIERDTQQAA